jgi:hypothetical protein
MLSTNHTIRTCTQQLLAAARSGSRGLMAAGVIALGAMSATPPIANAAPQTEAQIKQGCKEAGGSYATSTSNGHRYSACAYNDINGDPYTDTYTDGTYTGTTEEVKGTPTSKPAPPPLPRVQNPGLSPQ